MPLIAIVLLVLFGFRSEAVGADFTISQDIVLKNNKGDILTSQSNKKEKIAIRKQNNASGSTNDIATVIKNHIASVSNILNNTDNMLDVYMGKCRYMSHALEEVKSFQLKHKDMKTRFFNLRTDDTMSLAQSDIGGLEISPATEAKKYETNNVPAYIFHINGKVFKVSGDTSLEDVYQNIIHNGFDGEKENGFIDGGTKGSVCPAYIPEFGISALSERQKEAINREFAPPGIPNIPLPASINIQEYDKARTLSKKIASSEYMEFKKYIVFSATQREWAKQMINDKAIGCCTNCGISSLRREFGPYIQMCSRDMLNTLGVAGVPTIVNFQ
jgi:hypothetical protein